MQAAPFWLCLEGQNFSDSIFDTQDLSTIRGGSLLLRDLVTRADDWLVGKLPGKVDQATKGGSVGIWRLRVGAEEIPGLMSALRAHLGEGPFRHLRYGLAAVVEDSPSYSRQRNRLRAAIQRQRLSQSRVAYPEPGKQNAVCEVDFVRPVAQSQEIGQARKLRVSQSVHDRRRHGMDKKQKLIAEETALTDPVTGQSKSLLSKTAEDWLKSQSGVTRPFAMQTSSISDHAARPEGLKTTLADKICVITLDGNGFGKVQDEALTKSDTLEAQQVFDNTVAGLRARIIAAVFSEVIRRKGYGKPSPDEERVRQDIRDSADQVARFELLLWGGDEIMFIVPARLGWPVLEIVGRTAKNLDLLGEPVSFSIGAVFCHHDAPIARIKKLADDLAGHIKGLKPEGVDGEDRKGRDGKAETLAMVEVLESFDHIGTNLTSHLARAVPKPTGDPLSKAEREAFRALDLEELQSLRRAAEALAAGRGGHVSRGRLRQVAQALHSGRAPGASYRDERWVELVSAAQKDLRGDAKAALKGERAFSQDRFFALLEAYWDYLVPERQAADRVGLAPETEPDTEVTR
ncbi:hypothetical protein [Tabrizicola fusiformis]|uniref:hypothetical protein n=1 Tax=Tabrizicola sp. SY72 TaxID=2741673 RepID=UPI00157216CE|nr:hypothetical protein [Tabrizicola sp. SY72]NTT85948.1 hypothetical protein [Tabrizicola sp. SY72]